MYRHLSPDESGVPMPAATPEKTASFTVLTLAARPGRIVCNRRDYDALRATHLAPRVDVMPFGGPQPGTVWLEEVDHA